MPHTPEKKWLYFPIEIKARELDGKAILSYFAAAKGYGVIIGGQSELKRILAKDMAEGAYVDKSIASNKVKEIKNIVSKGIKLVCFDEEGLLQSRKNPDRAQRYATRRLSKENLENTELFLCWGENQAGIIHDFYPEYSRIVRTTGSPRIDIVRPEMKQLHLNRMKNAATKYDPYIFIPSTFSSYINANSPDFIVTQAKRYDNLAGKGGNQEEYAFYQRKIDFVRKNFEAFKEAILELSKEFPNYNIVIRPHPQDQFEVWNELAKPLKNVHIVFEGTAIQWIAAAKATVHNNCTTGVEGAVLGSTIIHYTPHQDAEQDRNIAGAETHKVSSLDELKSTLKAVLGPEKDAHINEDYDSVIKSVSPYLHALSGDFASEVIVKELNDLNLTAFKLPVTSIKLRAFVYSILLPLKRLIDKTFTNKIRVTAEVEKQKFSGINKSELQSIYKEIQLTIPDKQLPELKIRELGKNIFEVTKA